MRQTLLALVLAAGLAMPAIADDKKVTPPTPPADPTNTVGNMAKDADKKIEEAKQAADAELKKLAGTLKADAPAEPAKKWIIAADAKPVDRKELEGGLIVEDFVVGTGTELKADSTVVINYHGTLKDGGKTFDSSFERGQPVAFPLARLIPGWQKGVPGMKVGGLRRLTVPSALAYGDQGQGEIPGKADLIFIIEALGTPSYVDVAPGTGEETVSPASVVITKHTIKGKDGKVLSQSGADKPYIWFPGEIQGLGEQMAGMKVGSKRTIMLPGAMIQQASPMSGIQLPPGEDVTFEIEVVMFRNLPMR